MRTWAVVPVKARDRAKERLADSLTPLERAELVDAMLSDVLAALGQSRTLGGLAVLSADPAVLALARSWGAEALLESEPLGYREAADAAARLAATRGWEALLIVPGDVPLVTAADVDGLIGFAQQQPRAVVLCPDRGRRGTNALLRRPPTSLAAQFGADSLHCHQTQARAQGLTCRVWPNPNLALDVDTADDLQVVLARGGGAATRRALAHLAISSRGAHLEALAAR